jgi:hypothetical protein
MKKKQKQFLGFAVLLIAAIITMTGCELPKDPEFPSEFIGTWERAFQTQFTNTLTFTSKTLKPSNQSSYRNLVSVSGDSYSLENASNSSHKTTLIIKLVGDNLEITEAASTGTGWNGTEDDWTGRWKRK